MESKLLIEEKLEAVRQSCQENLAVKLNESKGQYKQLKRNLIYLQSKYLFLKSLGEDGQIDEDLVSQQLIECSQQNGEANAEIESTIQSIKDMAGNAQELLQERSSLQETAATLMQSINEKKAKLAADEAKLRAEFCDESMESMSLEEIVKTKESEIHTVDKQIETYKSLKEKWNVELEKLRVEFTEKEKLLREAELDLEQKNKLSKNTIDSEYDRLKEAVCTLSAMQGLEILSSTPNHMTIRILNPGPVNQDENNDAIELDITYAEDKCGMMRIADAKVNVYGLNIDEMIKEALELNCLHTLVTRVRSLWLQSYRLLTEVETLREQFALDWLPDSGHVTVLYGDVMCTLSVTSQYPAIGSTSLIKVTGTSKIATSDLSTIKPSNSNASLTDWLKYLQDILVNDS